MIARWQLVVRRATAAMASVAAVVTVVALLPPSTGTAGALGTRADSAAATPLATLTVDAPSVEVKPAGKPAFVAANSGRALHAGDVVRTSPTGSAQIDYVDGSLTRLDVSTEYKIVKLSNAKGIRKIDGAQSAGQTWHRVARATGSGSSYQVDGAHATAAVLGTAFVVTCTTHEVCTFIAVIDDFALTPEGGPKTAGKTVTLTPGDQVQVTDADLGAVTTLTQEDLLAIEWISENLQADHDDGKSAGASELASQPDPPPTRPPSTPPTTPPPPPPPAPPAPTGSTDAPPVDLAPVVVDDAYSMPEDTLLVIAAPGVLGNDGDPEGSPLEAFLTSLPAHGSLTFHGDGSFVYFPDANFHGSDAFTYVAGDGQFGSAAATVTITVASIADAPVAQDDAYTIHEDIQLLVAPAGVLGNDSDVDSAALTAVLGSTTSHGQLDCHADGSFAYTPDPDFHGTDAFIYRASDGVLTSNVATVTITVTSVNDPPLAGADAYAADQDTQLVVDTEHGVLGNDSDPEDDPLTAIQVTASDEDGPDHGTVSLATDGSFTYLPDESFFGTDHFTYVASDGQDQSDPVTVTITVDQFALAATIPVIHEVDSGGTVTFTFTTSGATSVQITSLPDEGTLRVGDTPVAVPLTIGADTLIAYDASTVSEGPERYSFTWTATNDDGTTGAITEYLWVGGSPVVPDVFVPGSGGEGEARMVDVYVNGPDLGDFTCAIWSTPPGQGMVSDILFQDGYWTMVYTPAAGTDGTIIVLHVSAGFSPDCDGPWAEFAHAYVPVGFTPEAPQITGPSEPVTSPSADPVEFSVTVTDAYSEFGLPITVSVSSVSGDTDGTVELVVVEGDTWTYRFTPSSYESTTVVLEASNGFATAQTSVDIEYLTE